MALSFPQLRFSVDRQLRARGVAGCFARLGVRDRARPGRPPGIGRRCAPTCRRGPPGLPRSMVTRAASAPLCAGRRWASLARSWGPVYWKGMHPRVNEGGQLLARPVAQGVALIQVVSPSGADRSHTCSICWSCRLGPPNKGQRHPHRRAGRWGLGGDLTDSRRATCSGRGSDDLGSNAERGHHVADCLVRLVTGLRCSRAGVRQIRVMRPQRRLGLAARERGHGNSPRAQRPDRALEGYTSRSSADLST